MTEVVRAIHHFEDEPVNVDWIPACLFNRYRLEHPEWFESHGRMERDPKNHLVTFTLSRHVPPVRYEYRSYVDRVDFQNRFPRYCRQGDIVFLDMYVKSARGLTADGLEAYDIARQQLGSDQAIYFMTAYPSILSEKLPSEVHVGKTFPKPIDANEIVDLLLKHFELPS